MREDVRSASAARDCISPITQFLNRSLALSIAVQDQLFAIFKEAREARVEAAIAVGTLDVGVESLRTESLNIDEERRLDTGDRAGQILLISEQNKN